MAEHEPNLWPSAFQMGQPMIFHRRNPAGITDGLWRPISVAPPAPRFGPVAHIAFQSTRGGRGSNSTLQNLEKKLLQHQLCLKQSKYLNLSAWFVNIRNDTSKWQYLNDPFLLDPCTTCKAQQKDFQTHRGTFFSLHSEISTQQVKCSYQCLGLSRDAKGAISILNMWHVCMLMWAAAAKDRELCFNHQASTYLFYEHRQCFKIEQVSQFSQWVSQPLPYPIISNPMFEPPTGVRQNPNWTRSGDPKSPTGSRWSAGIRQHKVVASRGLNNTM